MIIYNGNIGYCDSHKFIFDMRVEDNKLFNGQPCIYTDKRFKCDFFDYAYNRIDKNKKSYTSLKSAIRFLQKIQNIPFGTRIRIDNRYYTQNYNDIFYSYIHKKKSDFVEPKYEISKFEYLNHFFNDVFGNELIDSLRINVFLVEVINENTLFISGEDYTGEIFQAFDYGKIIAYSSGNNDYRRYVNWIDNILYSNECDFNKFYDCATIPKSKTIDEIISILMK